MTMMRLLSMQLVLLFVAHPPSSVVAQTTGNTTNNNMTATATTATATATATAGFKYLPTLTNISVMDYSSTYRQSVCERQQAFSNGTAEFRDSLRGLKLNVMLLMGAFGGLNPVDGSIPSTNLGMDIIVLDELARRAGFTWRTTYGAVSTSNLTVPFDDLLDWSIHTFDVSAVEWSRTRTRINRGTGYPTGHVDASIIMVGQIAKPKALNVWSFLQPFDAWVWLLIMVTFVICGLIYAWMEQYTPEESTTSSSASATCPCTDSDDDGVQADDDFRRQHHRKRRRRLHSPGEYIYFSGLTFLGDIKLQPTTSHGRLLVMSLAFWSLLVSSSYTANLASFLVSQNTPGFDVAKVSDAVRLQMPICAVRSAAPATLVQEEFPSARLVLIDGGYLDAYKAMLRGDCQLVLTTVNSWEWDRRDPVANPYCDLERVGRVYRFLPAGFATESDSERCTFLIQACLNLHMLEMEEDGFIAAQTKLVLDAEAKQNCDKKGAAAQQQSNTPDDSLFNNDGDGLDDSSSEQQLTLQNLGGLFICMYCVVALTCLMALWNHHRQRVVYHKKESRNQIGSNDLALEEEEEKSTEQNFPSIDDNDKEEGGVSSSSNEASSPTSSRVKSFSTDEKLDNLTRELEFIKEMMLINSYGKSKEE